MQNHNSEHKSKEQQPLKMLIAQENGVAEILKRVTSKYLYKCLQQSLQKQKT